MNFIIINFILLIITIILEYFTALIIIRSKALKLLGIMILINSLTLPIGSLLISYWGIYYWVVELVIVVGEIVLFKFLMDKSWSQSWPVIVICNLITAVIGFGFSSALI